MSNIKRAVMNGAKSNGDLKRMAAVGFGGGKGTPTVIITAVPDNKDACEICNKTAVCRLVTVHVDSEAITDMHICQPCHSSACHSERRRVEAQQG